MDSITISGQALVYICGGIVSGVVALIGFIVKGTLSEMKAIQGRIESDERALSEHKLYTEQIFAKDTNVQSALSRIHERIDKLGENVNEKFEIISGDIKKILAGQS